MAVPTSTLWRCDPVAAPYSPLVLADGAVGYWPLDDAGADVVDATGHGYTGTVSGTTTPQQPGPISEFPDGAMQCDVTAPTPGQVALPAVPLPVTPVAYTFEFWFLVPAGLMGRVPFLSTLTASPTDPEFMFALNDGFFGVYQPLYINPDSAPSAVFNDGGWHHCAARWGDTDNGPPELTVLFDGADSLAYRYVTNFRVLALPSLAPLLGRSAYWPPPQVWETGALAGPVTLASVAIYPSLLSRAQIAAHYAQRQALTTPPTTRGHLAFSATHAAAVREIVFTRVSADGQDVTAVLESLAAGDVIDLQVFNDPSCDAAYTVDAPPRADLVGGDPDVLYWCAVHAAAAATGRPLIVPDQMVQWTRFDPSRTFVVGDLVSNGAPFELVPANTVALIVAVDATRGILALFAEGTQAWFAAADVATARIRAIGSAPDFAGYVYATDLQLHEDWRGGFFDPVWHPNPPAGAFAVFARARGAPADTAPYRE